MKKIRLFISTYILFSFSLFAQIPNAGFENWTNGVPDNWYTFDIFQTTKSVTQTNDSHSGSSAVKMEVVQYATQPFPPYLQSFQDTIGIQVTTKYASLTGFYKLSALGTDDLEIFVTITNNTLSPIGGGFLSLAGSVPNYSQFSCPIEYYSNEKPEFAIIQVILADSNGTDDSSSIGSWAILDDLEFSGIATGVEENKLSLVSFSLSNNYPNPFNPTTRISYSIPEQTFVSIKIYDVLGKEVKNVVSELKTPGVYEVTFDASSISSGIYYYRIEAGNYAETKKMILLK